MQFDPILFLDLSRFKSFNLFEDRYLKPMLEHAVASLWFFDNLASLRRCVLCRPLPLASFAQEDPLDPSHDYLLAVHFGRAAV